MVMPCLRFLGNFCCLSKFVVPTAILWLLLPCQMVEIVYSNHMIEASPHNHSKREQWFGPTISAAISSGSATHFGQLDFQYRGVCPRTSYHFVMCHSSLFGELVIFGKGFTCVLCWVTRESRATRVCSPLITSCKLHCKLHIFYKLILHVN